MAALGYQRQPRDTTFTTSISSTSKPGWDKFKQDSILDVSRRLRLLFGYFCPQVHSKYYVLYSTPTVGRTKGSKLRRLQSCCQTSFRSSIPPQYSLGCAPHSDHNVDYGALSLHVLELVGN